MTVNEHAALTHPCPACGNEVGCYRMAYCESACVAVVPVEGSPGFINGTTHTSEPFPHLHAKCKGCGFEFLTDTCDRPTRCMVFRQGRMVHAT